MDNIKIEIQANGKTKKITIKKFEASSVLKESVVNYAETNLSPYRFSIYTERIKQSGE